MSQPDILFDEIKDIFEENEKIIKKPINNYYEQYFEDTFPLKNNFLNSDFKIMEGCRIFKKNNGNNGYDEEFAKQKQKDFSGISEKISFIFPHGERIYDKRIGFRFYKEDPFTSKKEIPYFTLVLKDYRKFEILEKDSNIKDGNKKPFIIKNLNCTEIIKSIIVDKFNDKNNIDFQFPYSIAEILGFIYAIREKSTKNRIILPPYFPSPFIPETRVEIFDKMTEKLYIEPILYKQHASVLLFYFVKDNNSDIRRYNCLFDFSYCHYNTLSKGDPIFCEEMSSYLKIYPFKGPIQFGLSCSIWLLGTILTLIETKQLYLDNFRNNSLLFQIITKIHQIMKIKEIYLSQSLLVERNYENLSNISFISYKIALSPFISIKPLMREFHGGFTELGDDLVNYQILFDEFRKRIVELKMNLKYYKFISGKCPLEESEISNLIDSYNKAKNKFFELIQNRIKRINHFYGNKIYKDGDYKTNQELEIIKSELDNELDNRKIQYDYFNLLSQKDLFQIYVDNNDIFLNLLNN